MMKTYSAKAADLKPQWYIIDAEGQVLGRLASQIAQILRGKHKPTFTPHLQSGDFVVVINAEKIAVTGRRLDQKIYYRHSQYPGGLKKTTLRQPNTSAPGTETNPMDWPRGIVEAAAKRGCSSRVN